MSQRLFEKLFIAVDVKITSKDVTQRVEMWLKVPEVTYSGINADYDDTPAPTWGNYFDVRKGEVSYKVGEQPVSDEGKWVREGRQVCKASKLVAYLIDTIGYRIEGDYIPENELKLKTRFLELLSINAGAKDLEIQVSDDPECIYEMPTAYNGSGTLDTSCMRIESQYGCHYNRGFYNAMGAKIAYSVNKDGKLVARALLWEDVYNLENHTTFRYMDRIYGSEESQANFKEWAHENGYAHKVEQSFSNRCLVFPDKGKVNNYMVVNNPEWKSGFPYMDSLIYLYCAGDNMCISSDTPPVTPYYTLQNTNGRDVRPQIEHCAQCGAQVMILQGYYNAIGEQVYCTNCSCASNYYGCGILISNAVWSDHCNSYIYNDDRTIQVEGDWAPADHFHIVWLNEIPYFSSSNAIKLCDYCNDWHLAENVKYYHQLSHWACDECVPKMMARKGYHLRNGEWTNQIECEVCEKLCIGFYIHEYPQLGGKAVCSHCLQETMKQAGYVYSDIRYDWVKGSVCQCCQELLPPEKVKFYRLLSESVCSVCFTFEMPRAGYVLKNSHWVRNPIIREQRELPFAS